VSTFSTRSLAGELGLAGFESSLKQKSLKRAWDALTESGVQRLIKHGRFADWHALIDTLPSERPLKTTLSAPQVGTECSDFGSTLETLRDLGPWKKGPFRINEQLLDSEWRSDLKWERVQNLAHPLRGRDVLDVGTGNGYFLYRALGDGARSVLGLEPTPHYAAQYLALQRLFRAEQMALLPLTSEEFHRDCAAFDTVLSMGVLYHRRSPLDHLLELRSFLRPGGQLILETIVVDGPTGHSLVPEGRYAQMRNVWFLPTVGTLETWLKRLGMREIRSGPVVPTTAQEQRRTSWTNQPSLSHFLDPNDPSKTVEGHPAPKRVIITSELPS